MLELDPTKRISVENALEHPFLSSINFPFKKTPNLSKY